MCHLRMILIAGILSLRPKAVQRNAKLVRDLKEANRKIEELQKSREDIQEDMGTQIGKLIFYKSYIFGL